VTVWKSKKSVAAVNGYPERENLHDQAQHILERAVARPVMKRDADRNSEISADAVEVGEQYRREDIEN
jgi:hypothetical protein